MRHKGISKEETRQKIKEAVSKNFRSRGFSGVGVDALAKSAGVTSGAFYSHLGSKDSAFVSALTSGLDEVIECLPEYQHKHGEHWVEAFAGYYLSKEHQQDMETGCAMASLTSEVVRLGEHVHQIYEDKMSNIVDLAAEGLKDGDLQQRRQKAWAMLSVLIGGLNVVRAVISEDVREEISKAIIQAAIVAAGSAK